MATDSPAKGVVYAALAGNLLVAAVKAAAAAWTGSAAMLSEAIHSLVDTGNEVLLLYGMRRSTRGADLDHPVGHGRELYFWSFIVALLVFVLGAAISAYQGIIRVLDPRPVTDPVVNYIVLALAFVFESASWVIAWRRFRTAKGSLGYYRAFRASKDPTLFLTLFEDSAALIGIVLAAAGIFAATSLGAPIWDGVASVLIGCVLAVIATLLARESKSLLIGERADPKLSDSILRIAGDRGQTLRANGVFTVHLAPDQILAALSLEFADELRAPQIEDAVIDIEQRIRASHPEVVTLFVKPQTSARFKQSTRDRFEEAAADLGGAPPS